MTPGNEAPTETPTGAPTGAPTAALLRRLAANVRAVGTQARDAVEVGPFLAFLSPSSDDYLLSFAVPADGGPGDEAGWAPSIAALRAAFEARGRRLRLEFFAELHPALGPALTAAAVPLTHDAPVMALGAGSPGRLAVQPVPPGARVERLDAGDDEGIDRFLAAQRDTFRELADSDMGAWRDMLQAGLRDGTMRSAFAAVGGAVVSGATLMRGAGLAELAGVGTVPGHRGRGHAGAVCSSLLEEHLAGPDAACWLSAGPGADRLYRRLGFVPVGTQLNHGVMRA